MQTRTFLRTQISFVTTLPGLLLLITLRWRLTLLPLLFRKPLLLCRLLGSEGLGTVVLAHRLHDRLLLLGLDDGDGVWQRFLWAGLALWVCCRA
jgi:hypothetical protein